jgi:hypothetical protein
MQGPLKMPSLAYSMKVPVGGGQLAFGDARIGIFMAACTFKLFTWTSSRDLSEYAPRYYADPQ